MEERFKALYQWSGNAVEDVRFWCEPNLTVAAVEKIASLGFPAFDGIATFEARGFLLAGVAASIMRLPIVPIRKHKAHYSVMHHERVDYINWKNERESLTVLKGSLPAVKRVLIVDDILDTGRSLRAGTDLLSKLEIETVGAFYLLNSGTEDVLRAFEFPIQAILKKTLFEP